MSKARALAARALAVGALNPTRSVATRLVARELITLHHEVLPRSGIPNAFGAFITLARQLSSSVRVPPLNLKNLKDWKEEKTNPTVQVLVAPGPPHIVEPFINNFSGHFRKIPVQSTYSRTLLPLSLDKPLDWQEIYAHLISIVPRYHFLIVPGSHSPVTAIFQKPTNPSEQKSLNQALLRLMFCQVAINKGLVVLGSCDGAGAVALTMGYELKSSKANNPPFIDHDNNFSYHDVRIHEGSTLSKIAQGLSITLDSSGKYRVFPVRSTHPTIIVPKPTLSVLATAGDDTLSIGSVRPEAGIGGRIVMSSDHPELPLLPSVNHSVRMFNKMVEAMLTLSQCSMEKGQPLDNITSAIDVRDIAHDTKNAPDTSVTVRYVLPLVPNTNRERD